MPYVHADGAEAFAIGPVAGGSLAITAGLGSLFAAASPSAGSPLPLAVFRGPTGSEVLIGAVLVTGVSGDSLTIAGAVPGYVAPTVQAGDVVASVPLAADDAALWAAVATRVTTADLATALGPYALTSALSAYATTAALTSGLAGKQATLTAGSIVTSLLADSGVTMVKIADRAVSYAKLADAAGAGVLGAGAAGAHQLLTLDDSVAISGGVIRAKPLVCLGRWGTATDAAGATGLMTRDATAPLACVPYKLRIKAPTNPSGAGGGATIQIKVAGADLLTSAYTLAAGTTSWVTVSSGFALASIADESSIQPTISAIGGDVRGLIVEVWARGA